MGGAVRDALLGLELKDLDYVVVGGDFEGMLARGFRLVGRDFPVFLHPVSGFEYALARRERKSGVGYGGFAVDFAPSVALEEDLLRRDLTINALAVDARGQVVDVSGGLEDLYARRLRHVSAAFVEDPLRVLRLLRFYARFAPLGFEIAPETWALAMRMVASGELDYLTPERVWVEVVKVLELPRSALFFEGLFALGGLSVLGLQWVSEQEFLQMQAQLVAVGGRCGLAEVRLAGWLAACEGTLEAMAQQLPLPRLFIQWGRLFVECAPILRQWAQASALARWQVFKVCGSLRARGEIRTLVLALGLEGAVLATIERMQEDLLALDVEAFQALGFAGKALGEAIYQAQLAILEGGDR
nr:tRNA nucleotidyltransferase [Rappaport israeli]